MREAFTRRDVRDVANLHLIEGDPVHVELAPEPIRSDGIPAGRVGRAHPAAVWAAGDQSHLANQARDTLGAGRQPRRAQFLVHTRHPVCLPAVGKGVCEYNRTPARAPSAHHR
jgi:hypothetical protein